jgi:hypothetical protein
MMTGIGPTWRPAMPEPDPQIPMHRRPQGRAAEGDAAEADAARASGEAGLPLREDHARRAQARPANDVPRWWIEGWTTLAWLPL